MNTAPRMSVLLPLQDERDAGEASVRAWTQGQTADPAEYEVIALAPGEDPELERAVRPLLRDQDSWVVVPGADEYELFNIGADAARGEYVFVTEAHCVPERECLEAMLDELDGSGAPGVRGASVPDAHGALGVLERDAFEAGLREEEDPEHWRKVLIHSLAIRRDVYLAAGGLPPHYGDFAPWVLAMALDRRDQRLRFSPRPRVRHVYDGDLEHVGAHVRSFNQGEMRFRCEHGPSGTDPYLDYCPEWDKRAELERWGARRALRSGLVLRHPATAPDLLRHAVIALAGPRVPVAAARLRAALARLEARVARDPERRTRRFFDFWLLTARLGRLEGLSEYPGGPSALAVEDGEVDVLGDLSGAAVGLHDPERSSAAGAHRWTAPLAALRVAVPGTGGMRARLRVLPRPGGSPAGTRIAVDDARVAARETPDAIEFELAPGDRWISLACSPVPGAPGDRRRLGLCLQGLSFAPAD